MSKASADTMPPAISFALPPAPALRAELSGFRPYLSAVPVPHVRVKRSGLDELRCLEAAAQLELKGFCNANAPRSSPDNWLLQTIAWDLGLPVPPAG